MSLSSKNLMTKRLALEDELEEDDELELLEENGCWRIGSWGGKELLWKLEDDQLLKMTRKNSNCWKTTNWKKGGAVAGGIRRLGSRRTLQGAGRRTVGENRLLEELSAGRRAPGRRASALELGSSKRISSPCRTARQSPSSTSWYRLTKSGRFLLPCRQACFPPAGSQVGLSFLVAYQGNAELCWSSAAGWCWWTITIVSCSTGSGDGRRKIRPPWRVPYPGGDGKGDGDGREGGENSHDHEYRTIRGRWGRSLGTGEAVDQDCPEAVGVRE
ncbi:MAG: hypothetical protein ACLT8E_01115 [Akkermansia sp.]